VSLSGLVLVVDDEELNRKLLRALLTSQGFQVEEGANGEEALRKIQQVSPDLVLLDIMMPRVDGLHACRELKQDPRTQLIPVVLLTALSAVDDRVAGIEAGADDFLTKPFHQAELLARVRSLIRMKHLTDQLERTENILFAMAAAVEAKDPYTEGHLRRLEEYASQMSAALGLPGHLSTVIRYGALLHDIGKIGVPDAILHKRGRLTPKEFEIIKQHPAFGERICRPLRFGAEVGPIVRSHHERWDGSGYPDGLAGEGIPLGGRIVAIADAFDAMTTDRPYHQALPITSAIDELLQGAGTQWDPHLVECFATTVAHQDKTLGARRTKERQEHHTRVHRDPHVGPVGQVLGDPTRFADEHAPRQTYFNRDPRGFYFDFQKNGGADRYVIWGDPEAFHTWWKTTGVKADYPNPNNTGAFSTADPQTAGSAMKIPPLLYAKAGLQCR